MSGWELGIKVLILPFKLEMKKVLVGDAKTGCSKAEPKFSHRRRPLPGGAGRLKFNQLDMVTTFTYKPSLARIDARNFKLSW